MLSFCTFKCPYFTCNLRSSSVDRSIIGSSSGTCISSVVSVSHPSREVARPTRLLEKLPGIWPFNLPSPYSAILRCQRNRFLKKQNNGVEDLPRCRRPFLGAFKPPHASSAENGRPKSRLTSPPPTIVKDGQRFCGLPDSAGAVLLCIVASPWIFPFLASCSCVGWPVLHSH